MSITTTANGIPVSIPAQIPHLFNKGYIAGKRDKTEDIRAKIEECLNSLPSPEDFPKLSLVDKAVTEGKLQLLREMASLLEE